MVSPVCARIGLAVLVSQVGLSPGLVVVAVVLCLSMVCELSPVKLWQSCRGLVWRSASRPAKAVYRGV